MLRFGLAVLALFAGTLLLGAYLSPDDLRSCKANPGSGEGCEVADAVVAVSGGDTQGRTRTAIDLYQKGWAKKIIFSGAAADKTGPSNAAAMRNQAVESGVSVEDILVEEASNNTRENADQTIAIIEQAGMDSIILTTSPYHQRRAGLEFKRAASGQDIEIKNHPSRNDRHWPTFWWITPKGWYLATGEVTRIIGSYAGMES